MRYIALILFLLSITTASQAQTYSYVYIQGDKQVPFYVKLEGEMLPRYGKNYCIIPRLEAGIINIDILFQQNAYPAQHFVIKVPENGSRGFFLTQKSGAFSLYDLQQQFYLTAGNTADDDHAPGANAVASAPVATASPVSNNVQQPPVQQYTPPATQPATSNTAGIAKPVAVEQPVKTEPATPGQPRFIEDIQLNNDHSIQPAKPVNKDSLDRTIQEMATRRADSVLAAMHNETAATDNAMAPAKPDTTPNADNKEIILNSDCPQPLDGDLFEAVYKKALQQNEEESRLGYLIEQLGNCYTTAQAGILARSMDSDAARYTFLKKVYPRITDQSKFLSLRDLLVTDVWRKQFTEIVNH